MKSLRDGKTVTSQISSHIDAAASPLLRVEGLFKAFGGHAVLHGVSLEARRGEVVLLRGDNGSGKTTLLNILTGNLEPDAGSIQLSTNGLQKTFHFPKRWWQSLSPLLHFSPERITQQGVGRTWQDIRLFPTLNLRNNIAIATPRQVGENPAWAILRRPTVRRQEEANGKASETMLAVLGLKGREASSADKVSLGQSKRVAIARAVQAGARLLFLDEPLAGLDTAGVAEVMHLLEDLAHDEEVTLVIVEHIFNIPRILDLATTVWTLENGKVTVETPAQVRAELDHIPGEGIQGWMKEMCKAGYKMVDQKLPGGAVLSTVVPSDMAAGAVVLEVENVVVHHGRRLVIGRQEQDEHIQGLSFTLRRGQLAVLQAPNGWGKTTLLGAMAGLLPITQGAIHLHGRPIHTLPPWERTRRGMSFLQARHHTFHNLTVQEALRLAHVSDVPQNIEHLLNRRMSALSGGEKQRVALACAIHRGSFIVGLLDEPFAALDPDAVHHLWTSLRSCLHNAGLLVVVPSSLESAE